MERDESLRKQLLAEVETIAPILAEHALPSERLGRLDGPTVEALRKTRLLRFTCPRELGGDEVDPLTQLEVLEALARIDGSAGLGAGGLAGARTHSCGLKASGSCDYSIENVFVPNDMSFPLMDALLGKTVTGGAALRLGLPAIVAPFHMGIALGIARRALDEIIKQAIEKGRGFPPSPLPTHPHFQLALGKA